MADVRRFAASTCGFTVAAVLLWPPPARGPSPAVPFTKAAGATASYQESDLWLAPERRGSGNDSPIARGIAALSGGRAAEAVTLLEPHAVTPMLGGYARLYLGRAHLALEQPDRAAATARAILNTTPGGYLGEAALWLLADAAEAADRWSDAHATLQALAEVGTINPAEAHLRLGRAAEKVGDRSAARRAFATVYFEYPLSSQAADADRALAAYPGTKGPEQLARDLGRAERLHAGGRYADARKAFQQVRGGATGPTRARVDLRLAQAELGLQRYQAAHKALMALRGRAGVPAAELEYAMLSALRGLGRRAEYIAGVDAFVGRHPADPLAERSLNDLGTYYILADDDGKAAEVFAEMFARFPTGVHADRAAWKAGWWAYRTRNYRETARIFEAAAVSMRRADYRPSWLYWSARSHEELGEPEAALAWYRRTIADYRNSYYGREAARGIARVVARRGGRTDAAPVTADDAVLTITAGSPPENTPLIQALLEAGLWDDAVYEIRRIQAKSGTSPLLEATIAYALNRKGELRPAITAMRRAYPQFMAAGGEALPRGILGVIFPIAHWDLLRRYADERRLDRYLLAAQVAQESTFQAEVRSVANAYGLMQILPSTGRRYAPKVGVRPFSTTRLIDPDVNVRIGTFYFRELLDMFDGDAAAALAAYNAGENRVERWRAERPGLPRDEFVDDIPFPETQNYVKRILGTAEDYRILYGAGDASVRQSSR
jgi:soluble lytic murein transglycosylase